MAAVLVNVDSFLNALRGFRADNSKFLHSLTLSVALTVKMIAQVASSVWFVGKIARLRKHRPRPLRYAHGLMGEHAVCLITIRGSDFPFGRVTKRPYRLKFNIY